MRRFRTRRLAAAAAVFCAFGAASPAFAVPMPFDIALGGAVGSFTADDAGGVISAFSLTVNGITFDTLGMGNAAPVYDALANDIRGVGGTSGIVTNSVATAICGIGECVLDLEDSVDPGVIPPLYAIFTTPGGMFGELVASGEYAISKPGDPATVIPLPATIWMALAAMGGLVLVGRRRG
ncbi:MAG: VPLPA-CTERM sorting domain-containing protein [Pseudomonadota bacterium]